MVEMTSNEEPKKKMDFMVYLHSVFCPIGANGSNLDYSVL